METNDRIIKQEAFIGSNDVTSPFARGEKIYIFYMPCQKYAPYNLIKNEEMAKAVDVYDCLFKKDAKLKGHARKADSSHHEHHDGGQHVMYGVEFVNCETTSKHSVLQTAYFSISTFESVKQF